MFFSGFKWAVSCGAPQSSWTRAKCLYKHSAFSLTVTASKPSVFRSRGMGCRSTDFFTKAQNSAGFCVSVSLPVSSNFCSMVFVGMFWHSYVFFPYLYGMYASYIRSLVHLCFRTCVILWWGEVRRFFSWVFHLYNLTVATVLPENLQRELAGLTRAMFDRRPLSKLNTA